MYRVNELGGEDNGGYIYTYKAVNTYYFGKVNLLSQATVMQ